MVTNYINNDHLISGSAVCVNQHQTINIGIIIVLDSLKLKFIIKYIEF